MGHTKFNKNEETVILLDMDYKLYWNDPYDFFSIVSIP